jgi:eukaryotic-like serine/threonine-protein kinase
VMYELLAGEAPFQRATAVQTMAAVLEDDPRPLGDLNARVPCAVASVVKRCLAKCPDHRYPSTRALAGELARAVSRPLAHRRSAVVLVTEAAVLAAGGAHRVSAGIRAALSRRRRAG